MRARCPGPLALITLLALAGCDDGATSDPPDAPPAADMASPDMPSPDMPSPDMAPVDMAPPDMAPPPPDDLAAELGIDRYVGRITPIEERRDGAETTYTFDPADGPVCMRGAPYRASVRDTASDDLVIFLQGGGACWSGFCLAVIRAPAGVPRVDLLDPGLAANPVRDWDVVYLPYCDGSFFAGDAAHDDDINGNGPRQHRGLANLTAGLEVARARFPHPRRVLLAGSSGGAYGLLLAGPLLRRYYPDAELIVMADSGIGLARDDEPEYLDTIMAEFGIADFLPPDCQGCRARGHIAALMGWFIARDPNVRVGVYSAWYDSVLANVFLQVDPTRFADALDRETTALHRAWPLRFRRFIDDGVQHTSLLGDATGIIGADLTAIELPPGGLQALLGGGLVIRGLAATEVDGVTMSSWLAALIEGDTAIWRDLAAPRGEPPAGE
ncbi:MAG: hypothetical protein H6701_07910 [Myxococcales bacterium]|nr:hypothetical protein [Myxococcales bacterium]